MACLREKFYDGVVLDGRFKTISPLNHGSFGMVFMANDLLTDELVAIKCLTKKSASGDNDSIFAIDEKSEELACHARLGVHPNIVNLIHSFETEAHIYLVLEYCRRGDLYEAIRAGCGPLETEHVREFMLQLVDAVSYIHARGMYHRDIKPENIFLTQGGDLKLGDFGLATTERWSYETTVGSDRYMSPEQYESYGAGYAPAQADIWAIGVCLLNILFSRNPFTVPAESDPLFLDFARDKQSLFDVFPTMSQDTFEVIDSCMSLDPRRRSLAGVRAALLRVVSFTTFDESLDDFCTVPRTTVASANREPLRTPSLQTPSVMSPNLDQGGSFPWAKALHASPAQPIRQLSVIPDTESYSEDLFASSADSQKDWFSVGAASASLASVHHSLEASMSALALKRAAKKLDTLRPGLSPISGSLPIAMLKSKPLPSMSSIFGKKHDQVSKSWSDMIDEDLEEEEHERELRQRQEQNARTWSHESKSDAVNEHPEALAKDENSFVDVTPTPAHARLDTVVNDIDSDIANDGFFFQDTTPARRYSPPRYSPPSKRTTFDKWAALGDRRRAHGGQSSAEKSPGLWRGWRARGNSSGESGSGLWESQRANSNAHHNRHHHHHHVYSNNAAYGHKDHAWERSRARDVTPRKERAVDAPVAQPAQDLGDFEWVGGWHDFA